MNLVGDSRRSVGRSFCRLDCAAANGVSGRHVAAAPQELYDSYGSADRPGSTKV